jgi:hypothetical protein
MTKLFNRNGIEDLRTWGADPCLPVVNVQFQNLFLMIAGWVNRQQQEIIEYLQEENRIPLEQLGGKPRRFTDAPGAQSQTLRQNGEPDPAALR